MKHYYAVTIEQDKLESIFNPKPHEYTPGYYSYVVSASENENLFSMFDHIGGLKSVNACRTKKQACEIVKQLNDSYKQNGNYLFDVPLF